MQTKAKKKLIISLSILVLLILAAGAILLGLTFSKETSKIANVKEEKMKADKLSDDGNWFYTYNANTREATVIACKDGMKIANIPSIIDGYTVTAVGYPESGTGSWNYYWGTIESLSIPESVTEIVGSTFRNCILLENVTLPNSLITIGDYAFQNCTKLKNIYINGEITTTKNSLPNSIRSIGYGAFSDCESLTSIKLPNMITEIAGTFSGCTWLSDVIIPNSIKIIGDYTFQNCRSLSSITIGKTVTSIGENAFRYCDDLVISCYRNSAAHTYAVNNNIDYILLDGSLQSIRIKTMPTKTTYSVGEQLNTQGLVVEGIYSDGTTSVLTGYTCSPTTLNTIGTQTITVSYAEGGRNYTISFDVTVQTGTKVLQNIVVATRPNKTTYNSGETLDTTGLVIQGIYSDGTRKNLTGYTCTPQVLNTAGTQTITVSYTEGGRNYTVSFDVTVQAGPRVLQSIVVATKPSKTTYDLGETLDTTGLVIQGMYSDGTRDNLTGYTCSPRIMDRVGTQEIIVTYTENGTNYTADFYVYVTSVWSYKIHDDGITASVYSYSGTDTEVTIPSRINEYTITEIERLTFNLCKTSIKSIIIPNTVKIIDDDAFNHCTALENITIPNSVTEIGKSAFSGCSSLTSITIPNSVTSIENATFYDCISLTNVTIPNSVTTIKGGAFENCTALENITIPNSVTTIGSFAFSNCTSLTNITIPRTVTIMEDSIFSFSDNIVISCYRNSTAHVYAKNNFIDYILLDGIESIKVTQEPNKTTYNRGQRLNTTGLVVQGKYSDGTTEEITNYTCTPIELDTEGVQTITVKYSEGSKELTTSFDVTVEEIWEYVINDDGITATITRYKGTDTQIDIPKIKDGYTITKIGNYAFSNCTALTNITIPNSVTTIKTCAFDGCTSLTSIIIPDSVTEIEEVAFNRCTSLVNISVVSNNQNYSSQNGILFNKDKTRVIQYPMAKVGTTYVVPNTVTEIGAAAFIDCTLLENITLLDSVVTIEDSAFLGCTKLENITIPTSVINIEEDILEDCDNVVISCYKNSTAHIYAENNNIDYTLLDELVEIKVKSMPDKTSYTVGDTLDVTGLIIEGVKRDNTTSILTGYTCSPTELSTEGTQTITVTYIENEKELKEEFYVAVKEAEAVLQDISIKTMPNKVDYYEGDVLDKSGLVIEGTYSNGTTAIITGYTCTPEVLNIVGTQEIIVNYAEEGEEFNKSFNVNVQKVELANIAIAKNPNKTTYTKGRDELDLTGGKIKLTYNNGNTNIIDILTDEVLTSGLEVSEYDKEKLGKQTITVTYTEDGVSKSATFDVEVIGIIIEYEENEDGTISIKNVELIDDGNSIEIPSTIDGKTVTGIGARSIPGKIGKTAIRIKLPDTLENIDPNFKYTKKNTASLDVTPLRKVASISNAEYSLKVADEEDEEDEESYDDFVFEVNSTNTIIIAQLKERGWHYILADKDIANISVYRNPNKTEYLVKENLDISGGILLVTYTDANCEPSTIPMQIEEVTCEGFDSSNEGIKTITVKVDEYGEIFETEFHVTVKDYIKGIIVNPSRVDTVCGTSIENIISENNIKYVVRYEGKGEQPEITLNKNMVNGYDPTNISVQHVTVTYVDNNVNSNTYNESFEADLTINVTNGLTRIDMTAPTRTEYNHGESLDLSTMQIRYTYADGREIEGSIADVIATEMDGTRLNMSPTSYNSSNRLTKTIKLTIIKGDVVKTINHTITILNNIKEIRMKPGTYKTEYKPNEELDLSGVKITAIRAVGQEDVQVTREMVSGFDTTTVGSKVVTISYGGEETTFTITVAKNKIKSESTSDGTGSKITEIEPNDDEDEIEIPKITDGKNVKEIGDYVIKPPKAGLTVIIPSTVEEIGEHAFDGCDEITIECETGSAAHQYAIEHGMNYELIDKVIANISMYVLPDKTVYEKNENLDLTGGRLLLTYTDGYTSPISIKKSGVAVSGYNKTVEGTQNLTVTYKGHETSFDVNVLGDYIKGIDEGTTLQELKEKFGSDTDVKVYDTEGNEITDGKNIGTGMTIEVTQGGKTIRIVAIVKGDLDGDGRVTIVDVSRLQMHYIGIQLLSQIETNLDRLRAFEMAADTNEDGSIGIVDVSQIKMHYLGIQLFN